MQRLEVSGAVRHICIYMSLGVKGLRWPVSPLSRFSPGYRAPGTDLVGPWISTFWRTDKSLANAGNRTTDYPARSQITTLTELSRRNRLTVKFKKNYSSVLLPLSSRKVLGCALNPLPKFHYVRFPSVCHRVTFLSYIFPILSIYTYIYYGHCYYYYYLYNF
jgi:hypothetical protein